MKLSQKNLMRITAKTNGRCFYCNRPAEEVDHFISKAKWKKWGLLNDIDDVDNIENLVPACKSCNASKNDKEPEVFFGNAIRVWSRYARVNFRVGLGGGKSEHYAIWGLDYKDIK